MKRVLMLLIAALLLGGADVSAAGTGIVIDGSTTVGPIAKSFAAYYMKKTGVAVTVSESGSGNGAKSLINGACDIAAMSRDMKPQEIAAARKMGVNPVQHVAALDAIAIIVNPANPVRGLTRAQIAGIYTGRYTNWQQVGGPNARIVVIQRESNSGTQESFKTLVTGKASQITRLAETQASNGAVKNRVSTTRTSIGFIGMGFVDSSVRPIPVDGVVPTVESVRSGTYPLWRKLYFYTNGVPVGQLKEFLSLSATPDGMRIISELGYISR
ncbi:phosphate ABC transporter substrate-binding protein [Chlorobium sp. N1]|uniref:phosphate ABC transporter substrate-binding protein n=1 Tax=Chlorobium sp. N1 TaxID=2491138 RepID=UPI00103A1AC3|nr:phosphate ABC transporter substrate-binding protein [Chlorobium sp. N1]TCD48944.1 phosphate ABC transporter substrate-binding protein [Chlorobium sp. N1]